MTSYIALAQNLDNDDAEWQVSDLSRAEYNLGQWLARPGRWIGHIRPVGDILPELSGKA